MVLMTLVDLAKAVQGELNTPWINIQGPGHKTGDRSLGFRLDHTAPDGFRFYSFSGDDPEWCREHIKTLLQKVAVGVALIVGEAEKNADQQGGQSRIGHALIIWKEAQPAEQTIVEQYLNTRGCKLTDAVIATGALRFHPECPFGDERVPAMVALMTDVITGEPRGIYRTALRDDGSGKRLMKCGRPAKMALGPSKRAAIKLIAPTERMGIAEGIETALSAQQISNLPVWSALSAGGVAYFPNISGVKHLTIFADHDEPGLAAALKCGRRLSNDGIEVEVRHPERPNTDWNDYLVKRSK
jgi:putative DNA primase/helicase